MRVAVLSDIHGHLPALEAVLADVDRAPVDAVVLTGDIAAGPMPVPTLDRLLDLGDRAVWVRGNGVFHESGRSQSSIMAMWMVAS
jgi:predicted phosphodiesterase